MTLRPCLTCGRPSHNARCADHTVDARRVYNSQDYQADRAALLATATHCHWCGEPSRPGDPLTADHEPPLAIAAKNRRIVAAHQSCNSRRGADTRNRPGGPENLSAAYPPRYPASRKIPAALVEVA